MATITFFLGLLIGFVAGSLVVSWILDAEDEVDNG